MKIFLKAIAIGAFVLLFTGLQACKDSCTDACNTSCDNYDPCCPVQAADASFEIRQRPDRPSGMKYLEFEPMLVDDVVYGYTELELQAREGFSDYQYFFIKDGEVLNRPNSSDGQPNYTFNVGNAAEAFDLTIRLEVWNEAGSTCDKDTFAVHQEVVRVVPFGGNPIFGRYVGNYEAPFTQSEDFEIHIEKADYMDPVDTLWYEDHIKNPFLLHKDCDGLYSKVSGKSFIFFSVHNNCCKRTEAIGKLVQPNKIEVLINEEDSPLCERDFSNPRREKVFIGTRIP